MKLLFLLAGILLVILVSGCTNPLGQAVPQDPYGVMGGSSACTDSQGNTINDGECGTNKPDFCANGILVPNCQVCGCPVSTNPGYENVCQPNGYCQSVPKCPGGVSEGQCSNGKECKSGVLIDNCSKCGCPAGMQCRAYDNTCVDACSDGTPVNQCSESKPMECKQGTSGPVLVGNCGTCGCPEGEYCNTSTNTCAPACIDGTPVGACSNSSMIGKPAMCLDDPNDDYPPALSARCKECGCPADRPLCHSELDADGKETLGYCTVAEEESEGGIGGKGLG